jgi:tetratricopeptide (TPR) repeat protein/CHAT domain-containing protein
MKPIASAVLYGVVVSAAHAQPANVEEYLKAHVDTGLAARIEAAGLDAATADAWRRYAADFVEVISPWSGAGENVPGASMGNGFQSPDISKILQAGEPALRQAPLIEVQASGAEPRAQEWERLNAEVVRLYKAGDYAAATVKAEEALRLAEEAFGPDHPSTLASVNNLAGLYQAQGRYAEAEPLFWRSLKGVEKVLGPDHPVTLSLVNSLAIFYHIQGRYAEAEPLYRRALEGRERTFGPDNPWTLASVNNLATLYQAQGRYDEAELLFVRSLKGYERALGPDHPDTLISAGNLAGLYQAQGRYDEAEPLMRRALEGHERTSGRDDPQTLIAASNLALLYRDQGRYEEAEQLLLRTLTGLESALGPDHSSTLTAANNLAGIYQARGRYAEAEPLYRRALEGRERRFGPDHPATLTAVGNLAVLYEAQGRYSEAEPLFRRALEGFERKHGPDHQNTLIAINNLAMLYLKQGHYEEAEPLLLRALEGFKRALGPDHPLTFVAVSNLAELYQASGRHGQAEPLFQQLLEGLERVLGPEHPSTLAALRNYFNWRSDAAQAGFASRWVGDERALRLTKENLAAFNSYLVAGAQPARLADQTSLESRGARLLDAFERARFAGVAGSDAPDAVALAGALAQRFHLSTVAAALDVSSRRLADPERRALLDERTRLAREIENRFKALNALREQATRNPVAEASVQAEIDRLAAEATAIATTLAVGDQGQAEIDGVVVEEDLAAVASALNPDEAVIFYSSAGEHYLAFVIAARGATAVSLRAERGEIARKVSELRGGLRLPFRIVGGKEIASGDPRDLPPFDLETAKALYDNLIAPLSPYLDGVQKLIVVADGPLQSLPFGVLVNEVGEASLEQLERYKASHYLLDRYSISMQPSISAIRTLRARTPRAKGDLAMLGFADPVLGDVQSGSVVLSLGGIGDAKRLEDLPELPQTRSLLNIVGLALGARPEDLRYREKAREADFRAYDAALPRYRMLTFATHGLVSDEIKSLDLEEPALVMSLPPVAPGKERPPEDDGLLLASDIVGFEMDADLVILAACNTAAADGTPGAEPLSGLAKAFMARGARALLVSHWQADANSSAVLIPAMARYAETDGFAEGLARAQRDLRLKAAFDPDPLSNTLHHAHPAIWGAFTLIGDPGR